MSLNIDDADLDTMSLNIDDADLDTDITGVEKIPVSDGGFAESNCCARFGRLCLESCASFDFKRKA